MTTCPSEFTLDDRDIHGAPPDDAVGRHLASCARCATRLAGRAALQERFRIHLSEPLWRRVATRPAPPRSGRRWWRPVLLASALTVTAAVVLVPARGGKPSGPPSSSSDPRASSAPEYRLAKGAPGVEITGRREGSAVFRFDAGIVARAGDEIQLEVRAGRAGDTHVLVGSVDGTGAFAPFYPASLDGESVALPPAGRPLSPPIVLDDAPGPERIVVIRSNRPLPVRTIAALAKAGAERQERFTIPGPAGAGADVRWVVVAKEAAPPRGDEHPSRIR